ncbi:methyltransferase domain-containing protein [Kineosporia rhizophila]|uniref:methyltransferase domain-containing protein n=1 Tax=Kineosporia rhizophila TaxID=84633 RepID=UPI001E2F718B|nr:methyltransferase domain-containing protein [Kineosporia rhizophila]MCE0536780.1 methyltransferase domain-containing protein [Kineosporia rhizophila]
MSSRVGQRVRNDPAQYDDLTDEWWPPHGRFAALHWLARARAGLIPAPPRPGAPLLDVACGAGLLQPHLTGPLSGWAHVGVDLSRPALHQARAHGVGVAAADVLRLPFADSSFACVVAGEVLEHLPDLPSAVAEISRVLAPGGTLVVDTLNDTWLCRIAMVRIAERLPGGPPPGVHDPRLLVSPVVLKDLLARHGVRMHPPVGLRPDIGQYLAWLARRRSDVTMRPTGSVAMVYQATASKDAA